MPNDIATARPADSAIAPTLAAFGEAVAASAPKHRAVKTLYPILADIDPRATREEREDMMIALARWVGTASSAPVGELSPMFGGSPAPSGFAFLYPQAKRLALLAMALERFPAFRERVSRLVQVVLRDESALGLLARVGIPGDRGLLSETIDRLSRRLMPQPVDEADLVHLVVKMFPKRSDTAWLEVLKPSLLAWFIRLVRSPIDTGDSETPSPSLASAALGAPPAMPEVRLSLAPTSRNFTVFAPLRAGLLDAILLLASRLSSAGLSDAIRARSPACPLRESPFFRFPRAIDAFLASPRHDQEAAAELAAECRAISKECRATWLAVLDRLENQGVSVDVVYRLELIDRALGRIELLLEVLVPQDAGDLGHRATKILAVALEERRRERSLSDIVRTNTRLIARKIIERAGESGEHYITTTRREYLGMLWSAGGGGLLTAGTVFIKVYCTNLKRAPLQEGLLNAANYACGFLLMQLLGFSLATKQSSMTAASLAGSIKEGGDAHELVTMIARVTRSQLAAAAGNVVVVIPSAIVADLLYEHYAGTHYFTPEYAKHFVESIQCNDPMLWLYAGVTGVLLWSSSIAAGWLENWSAYRRLPEAIAEHRIKRVVGERVTKWASRVFARNIAGFGGNVSIGLLLGLTPVIMKFAGIPIDIRHITLSTGALVLSMLTLGTGSLSEPTMRNAVLGIGAIGIMNFGVSFLLAITVAMRAREVSAGQAVRMLFAVVGGFFRSPVRFFLPVEKVDEAKRAAKPAH